MAVEQYPIDDRDQWLELRRTVVNASEVALVLGLGRYGSLAKLFAEKKGLSPTKDEDNAMLRRGRWREATVFEALAEERPHWTVVRAKTYLRDPELRLGATPDGFALRPDKMGRGVIEAKSISRNEFRLRWLQSEDDDLQYGEAEVPIYYKLQALQTMMLANTGWGVVAVVVEDDFGAYALRVFEIERDTDYERMIIDGVAKFQHDHLDAGVMPDFVPQLDSRLVKSIFRLSDGSVADLSSNNIAPVLAEQLAQYRTNEREAKKAAEAVRTELLALVGNATYAKLPDGRWLQCRTIRRKAYAVEATDYRELKLLDEKPPAVQDVQQNGGGVRAQA